MIIKSYLLEQNLEQLKQFSIYLFYGDNQGLKNEFKEKIKKFENKEILNLFQEEIIKNKNLLFNEIKNASLFNQKKIILINEADNKIVEIIEEIKEIIKEEKIYIFSNNLDKKSKLRNFFEKNKKLGLVACYPDNEITMRKIILNKLKNFGNLTNDIINTIIQATDNDRNKVNNEIEKIISCFSDKKIDQSKLISLLNLKTNEDFDKLKDEVFKGNKKEANILLSSTVFDSSYSIYYLNIINQRINKLKEIIKLKNENNNIETLVNNLKPPIFWKDKPVIIHQAKKWTEKKLNAALKNSYNVELKIKSNSFINKELLVKKLLTDICVQATSS